eukprot:TRINITY_DN814_c0_g1_i1.p1 TRINITY_DN814_c0_g1~~TRINITY_DN814_c0_g1_i1.p1  ORF type:complete len:331 (-),score=70.16 TRINITY_DN814_c0_g1_i1:54-1046(-)
MLTLEPLSINFPPPYDRVMKRIVKIENKTDTAMSFKVKTTAPKRYCVLPSHGFILPGQTTSLKVLLNLTKDPPKINPSALKDYKDKFQVQSILVKQDIPSEEDQRGELNKKLWESVSKDEIRKQKLRATFRPEADSDGGDSNMSLTATATESNMFSSLPMLESSDIEASEMSVSYPHQQITQPQTLAQTQTQTQTQTPQTQSQPQQLHEHDHEHKTNEQHIPEHQSHRSTSVKHDHTHEHHPTSLKHNEIKNDLKTPTPSPNTNTTEATSKTVGASVNVRNNQILELENEKEKAKSEHAKLISSKSATYEVPLYFLIIAFIIGILVGSYI